MKKNVLAFVFFSAFAVVVNSSCTKVPEACITTDKKTDRFVVNEEIHFHANCSQNAESFVWRFENNAVGHKDGIIITRESVKFRFSRPGRHLVKLEAKGGNHSSEAFMTVYVYEN